MADKLAHHSKYSEAKVLRLCEAYELGLNQKNAAAFASIGVRTLRRWLVHDLNGNTIFAGLKKRIEEAEARGAARAMATIVRASGPQAVRSSAGVPLKDDKGKPITKPGNWQAAAWILERRHGYTKTGELHVTADVKVDAGYDLSKMGVEELRSLMFLHDDQDIIDIPNLQLTDEEGE